MKKTKKKIRIRKGSPAYYILPMLAVLAAIVFFSIPSSVEAYLGNIPR